MRSDHNSNPFQLFDLSGWKVVHNEMTLAVFNIGEKMVKNIRSGMRISTALFDANEDCRELCSKYGKYGTNDGEALDMCQYKLRKALNAGGYKMPRYFTFPEWLG